MPRPTSWVTARAFFKASVVLTSRSTMKLITPTTARATTPPSANRATEPVTDGSDRTPSGREPLFFALIVSGLPSRACLKRSRGGLGHWSDPDRVVFESMWVPADTFLRWTPSLAVRAASSRCFS